MSNPTEKSDPRQAARRHTALMREVLRGKVSVHVQQPPDHGQRESQPDGNRNPKTDGHTPHTSSRRHRAPAKDKPQSASPSSPSSHSKRHLLTIGERLRRPGRGRIAQLMKRTERLSQVNQVLHTCLQSPLNDHATLASLEPSGWVVHTDSSAWAYRLRYAIPKARRLLQEKLGVEVPPLRVRVAPVSVPPPPPPPRKFTISSQTIGLLESTAKSLLDHGLRASLNRLARHARQRNRKD